MSASLQVYYNRKTVQVIDWKGKDRDEGCIIWIFKYVG